MRAIDGDELLGIERLLDTDVVRQSKTASWLLDQVLHDIQAMPTLTPPNEWVSVEERLPEHLKDVLALYGNGKIDIDWVDGSGDFKFGSLFDGVTHWMPLPAPPGKDNNVPTKAPNEPLTLKELREMDEPTPVWWEKGGDAN